MKKVVLPITTFLVGFIIALMVFKLSYEKRTITEQIPVINTEQDEKKPDQSSPKSKEQAFQDYANNLSVEKRELIASITPMDAHVWKTIRKEKEDYTIREGQEIWANGFTEQGIKQERFDEDIAEQFTGEYQGTYSFKDLYYGKTETYNITLIFKGTKSTDINTLLISGKTAGRFSGNFTIQDLGIDINDIQLIFTWYNAFDNPFFYISHFAFKLPLLKPGQTGKYILHGLNDEFEWKEIGEIELKKTR